MLTVNDPFYLQVSAASGKQVLHPGRLIEVQGDSYTGEFDEEEGLSLEEGQTVCVKYNHDRTFMQVTARINAIVETEPRLVITFETTGDPVSAESRKSFRVSTVTLNIGATLGVEDDCPVLEASATGLAVTASALHEWGDVLSVTICHEGQKYSGNATIHSARKMQAGRIRYGLHHVEDRHTGGNLQRGLQFISAAVQRLYLSARC